MASSESLPAATARPRTGEPRPIVEPLVRSTIYEFGTSRELAEHFDQRSDRFYTRFGNPTIGSAARALARLEGAEAGLLFASGMAAISTSLLALLRGGSHVVCQRGCFAQTATFLEAVGTRLGIRTTFVDATRPPAVAEALTDETALIYVESPSNPLLSVIDIAAVAAIARARGLPRVVDSTFATPLVQRPLDLGATLVVHSATKYLGGHSDVSCGAVLGPAAEVAAVYELQRLLGGIAQPDTAWLLERSLKTLELRMARHCQSAAEIASFLEGATGVVRVVYPGLASHPQAEVARRQMRAGGGMVAFEVQGGIEAARRVLDELRLVHVASSLGGVDSVAEIPAELDFAASEMPGHDCAVPAGLIRFSVGLESSTDLVADLRAALAAVFGRGPARPRRPASA
jgi:methionine-gamma-lyase